MIFASIKVDRVNGLPRVSASQIETWRMCQRKWAFARIPALRRSSPSAELGSRVHTVLEDWLGHGKAPDITTREGQIAMSAIPFLPPPRSHGLLIESDVDLVLDRAAVSGRVDATLVSGGLVTIYDHKTTRDFRWAKSPEDLLEDVQAAIYAHAAFVEYGCDRVALQWTYMHTERAHTARPTKTSVGPKHYLPIIEAVQETALEIDGADGARPHDLPPTATACEAFGGCPYSAECGITARQRMQAIMSQDDLKERLAKRRANQGINPTPASAPTPEPAPAPAPAASSSDSVAARLAAQRAAKAAAAAPTPAPDPAPSNVSRTVAEAARSVTSAPDGVPVEPIKDLHRIAGLRDQFAAAAANGMLARGGSTDVDEIASEAYAIADAMLRARER